MAYHFNFFRRYVLTLWGFVFSQTLFIWFIFRWEENLFWERILCWKWLDFLPVCWKEIMSAFAKCSVRLRYDVTIWYEAHTIFVTNVQYSFTEWTRVLSFMGQLLIQKEERENLGSQKKPKRCIMEGIWRSIIHRLVRECVYDYLPWSRYGAHYRTANFSERRLVKNVNVSSLAHIPWSYYCKDLPSEIWG